MQTESCKKAALKLSNVGQQYSFKNYSQVLIRVWLLFLNYQHIVMRSETQSYECRGGILLVLSKKTQMNPIMCLKTQLQHVHG